MCWWSPAGGTQTMTLMEEEHWHALPESPSPAAMLDMPGAASYAARLAKIQYPLPSTVWRTSISVVIPARNEAENLRWLLPQLATVDEVIVVDGESADGTEDVVRALCPRATFIRQRPQGKGAALRAGFAAATCDVIVMLDADGAVRRI